MSEPEVKRVLFVDDDPLVLRGLRRLLYPEVSTWKTAFLESGVEALALLEREEFDVMVTDMRMPQMDGLTLIKLTRERHPELMRIALSGHLDEEIALRSLPISHQFLAKPCSRETLIAALDSAYRVRALIQDPALRRLVGGVVELPSRPTIYARLSAALADDDTTIDEVAALVEADLGVASKVVQIVNSALYTPRQRITSLRPAVARIGLSRIKFLVLAAELFHALRVPSPRGWSIDEVCERSLLVGQLGMEMADGHPEVAEQVFLAGMLADVGQLVLAEGAPVLFAEIVAEARAGKEALEVVERRRHGVTHAEIGAYLLCLWGLTHGIVDAVAGHHRLDGEWARGPLRLVGVAAALVDAAYSEGRGLEALGELGTGIDLSRWRARADELRQGMVRPG